MPLDLLSIGLGAALFALGEIIVVILIILTDRFLDRQK